MQLSVQKSFLENQWLAVITRILVILWISSSHVWKGVVTTMCRQILPLRNLNTKVQHWLYSVWLYGGWDRYWTAVPYVQIFWQMITWSHAFRNETPHTQRQTLRFFKLKLSGLEQQKRNLSKHTSVSNRCLEASYYVSKRVVKVGKPCTIAEAL